MKRADETVAVANASAGGPVRRAAVRYAPLTGHNPEDTMSSSALSDRLHDFGTRFRGPVFHPEVDGYDEARRVWNGMVDRRPACIARCLSVDDVREALRFGRANGLAIAVRGGGHNAAGLATIDDGLV